MSNTSSNAPSSMRLIVKASLATTTKRTIIQVPLSYQDLCSTLINLFKGSKHISGDLNHLIIRYIDDENDLINLDTDSDLNLALSSVTPSKNSVINLKLVVNDKSTLPIIDNPVSVNDPAFITNLYELHAKLNTIVTQLNTKKPTNSNFIKEGNMISNLLSNTHLQQDTSNQPKPIVHANHTGASSASLSTPTSSNISQHPGSKPPGGGQQSLPASSAPPNKPVSFHSTGNAPQGYHPPHQFQQHQGQQPPQQVGYPQQQQQSSNGPTASYMPPSRVSSHYTGNQTLQQSAFAAYPGQAPNPVPQMPGNAAGNPGAPAGYPPSYGYPPNNPSQQQQQHGYPGAAQQPFGKPYP